MNLKKFISGVSALTIAASAFAGLAVTASADSTVKYSNNSLKLSDVAAKTNASVTQAVLTEGTDSETGISYVNVGITAGEGGKYSGFTLDTGISSINGLAEVQYKIRVKSYTNGAHGAIGLLQNNNYRITGFGCDGRNNSIKFGPGYGTYKSGYSYDAGLTTNTWYIVTEQLGLGGAYMHHFKVTSLDGNTTIVDADYDHAEKYTSDLTTVNALNFVAGSMYGYTADFDIADVQITEIATEVNSAKIQYINRSDSTILHADVPLDVTSNTKYIGDKGGDTYYYPKYIAVGTALYVSDSSNFAKTVKLTNIDNVYDLNYTRYGNGYFYDNTTTQSYGGSASIPKTGMNGNYSSGYGRRDNRTNLDRPIQITIPSTGVYDVEIHLASEGSNSDSVTPTAYVGTEAYTSASSNCNLIGSTTGTRSTCYYGNTYITAENVNLTQGNILSVHTGNANVGVDYILLKKAEYAVNDDPDDNGEIEGNTTSAWGETVTLTATPDEGYAISSLTVAKSDDPETTVDVIKNSDGTYSFTMPAYPVTVTANTIAVEEKTFTFGDDGYINMQDYTGQGKVTVTVTEEGQPSVSKYGYLPDEISNYIGTIRLAIIITGIPSGASVTTVLE